MVFWLVVKIICRLFYFFLLWLIGMIVVIEIFVGIGRMFIIVLFLVVCLFSGRCQVLSL